MRKLTTNERLAYSAPSVGNHFFYIPMFSILPTIYAKDFGLSLAAVAAVTLYARLFDGFADLSLGYLSDRHYARGGSRKIWVVVGALGCIAASYFLYNPVGNPTFGFYLFWMLMYFLAFTVIEIPHLTWGSELASEYNERARLFGVKAVFSNIGVMAFYALPLLPLYASESFTPEVLNDAFLVGTVFMLIGVIWCLKAPGRGAALAASEPIRIFTPSVFRNRPAQLYFAAFATVGIAYGMWFGLVLIYLDSYLNEAGQFALASTFGVLLGTLTIPLWLAIIRRWNKPTTWIASILLFSFQLVGMVTLAEVWTAWAPAVLLLGAHISFTCHNLIGPAILGDIVDYTKLRFGADRGGTFFAIQNMIFKLGLGLGGAASLYTASRFGFDPASAANDAQAVWGLKFAFVGLPLILLIIAIFLIARTPITPRRHRIIQRRLDSLQLRLALKAGNVAS